GEVQRDQLDRQVANDEDRRAAPDPPALQSMGMGIGPAIDLAEARLLIPERDGEQIGVQIRARLEDIVDAVHGPFSGASHTRSRDGEQSEPLIRDYGSATRTTRRLQRRLRVT